MNVNIPLTVIFVPDPDSPQVQPRWKYRTWTELNGYPYWGNFATYSGGGYVAGLGRSMQSAMTVFDELVENRWIDDNTRVVFIEYLVYNANTNLFGISMSIVEFVESGGNILYFLVFLNFFFK